MTHPQVDVLIPVYKVEQHIERCLRSVLAQTYPNLRIVLTDDASPDSSIAVAERLIAEENPHCHKVEIVRLAENQGLGMVRLLQLQAVEGKYTLFLDSDDWWHGPHIVTEWVAIAEERQCQIVISNYVHEYPLRNKALEGTITPRTSGKEHACAYLRGEEDAYLWNKLFRTDFLLQYLHFRKKGRDFLEDLAMTVPMLYNAQQVGYYHKPTVHYVHHGEGQLTARIKPHYIETLKGIASDLYNELPITHDAELRYSFNLAVARFVMMLCELPFRYYKAIRKAGFHVDKSLLAGSLKDKGRYLFVKLATHRATSFLAFLGMRTLLFVNRFRLGKALYRA